MVFSSLTFLLFFLPTVVILYLLCPSDRVKNGILILASLAFYAFGEPKWVFVMVAEVLVNYLCGILISKTDSTGLKRLYMILGVSVSLGFLFYFKYSSFVCNTFLELIRSGNRVSDIILPVGISFYTFQVLTYIVDVYLGKISVQKNFFHLLLYVSFFPQLIAGPIVNYKDIEGALAHRQVKADDIYSGFLRFSVGLGKKCLLANTCGEVVAGLDGASNSLFGAWLLAICFSLQLYFDFSGYSDMAIGLGRMFGFTFKENFLHPYTAQSATDFWRKWHVSLGAFFREYVYIPLGGNRVSTLKWCRNILIVWALTGIWHGASWNFCLWGIYYGILLLIEKLWLLKIKEKFPKFINIFATLIIVIIGWVMFYFTDISAAVGHIGKMFGAGIDGLTDAYAIYYFKNKIGFIAISIIAALPWSDWLIRWKTNNIFGKIWSIAAPVLSCALMVISMMLLIGQSYNPFLYFRF